MDDVSILQFTGNLSNYRATKHQVRSPRYVFLPDCVGLALRLNSLLYRKSSDMAGLHCVVRCFLICSSITESACFLKTGEILMETWSSINESRLQDKEPYGVDATERMSLSRSTSAALSLFPCAFASRRPQCILFSVSLLILVYVESKNLCFETVIIIDEDLVHSCPL